MSLSDMVAGTVAGELNSILIGRYVSVITPAERDPRYGGITARSHMCRVIEHVEGDGGFPLANVVRCVSEEGVVYEAEVLPRYARPADFDQITDPPYVAAAHGDIAGRYFATPAVPYPAVAKPAVPTGPPAQHGQLVKVQLAAPAAGRAAYTPEGVILALTVGNPEVVVFIPTTQQIVMALDDASAATYPRITQRLGTYWNAPAWWL